ncbi:MAG: DUF4145 domain-containing protein [Flavipsychrobacter sp.]|nr:DUF4145 domain-containing protein [Flavipsychrobacter sp.]
MTCPYCYNDVKIDFNVHELGKDREGFWEMHHGICPSNSCGKIVARLVGYKVDRFINRAYYEEKGKVILDVQIKPKGTKKKPLPPSVPHFISKDYTEASVVIEDSPMASAALSRRCLQSILREAANIKKGNLADEIQQVLDANILPMHVAESIDAVRNIGNFAAHPIKSTSTGEIVDVEQGEAEWNLEVIEMLCQYYYVEVDSIRKKRDLLNAKLADAGKPPLK